MSTTQVPEPWATALIEAGLTDPRFNDPHDKRPSVGQLARAISAHTSTVTAMIHGTRDTHPDTVAAAAKALRRPVTEVSVWVNQARTVERPYVPPAEVNLLSEREQAALTDLIMAIVKTRKELTGNAQHPAPKTQPPVTVTDSEVIASGEKSKTRGLGSRGRRPKPGSRGQA